MEAVLPARRTHQDRGKHGLAEQIQGQVQRERVDHHAGAERNALERVALASSYAGKGVVAQGPLGHRLEFGHVGERVQRRLAPERLPCKARGALRPQAR